MSARESVSDLSTFDLVNRIKMHMSKSLKDGAVRVAVAIILGRLDSDTRLCNEVDAILKP